MKVGTDGVLLGAWCPVDFRIPTSSHFRILDVGTGSGLIARMLMQRCPEAEVEGIDIDGMAVEQACENGVRAFQARLQEWPDNQPPLNHHRCYDLIVSNPPYFKNSLKNPDKGRELARHTDSLSYSELIKHSARLLAPQGQLAVILPAEAETEVRSIASEHSLFCTRITRVYSKQTKPARRVLLAFSPQPPTVNCSEDTLVLEDEKGGRSAAYSKLCEEFYL